MDISLKDQLIAWASNHNLNWLIRFHNCVRALFRDKLKEIEAIKTQDFETFEKLLKLPDGIEFPEDLKNKILYDNSNQLLIFKGIMSQEEKNKLLNLSTDDTYKKAIEALFQRSHFEQKTLKDALFDYDHILHINTFLMMYSHFEEWLYHYWRVYCPKVTLKNRKGSISRYSNVVERLGIDLGSQPWNKLQNAEKIRNCLLHANGRVSLYKDPQEIKNIIKNKGSGLKIIKDRVIISGDYLQRFNETISNTLNIMQKKGAQHVA